MPFTGEFVNEVNATRDERRHLLSVQSDGEELDRVGDSDVLIQQSGRTGISCCIFLSEADSFLFFFFFFSAMIML